LTQLDSDEMAFRSGSFIGYLTKCLRQAVWAVLDLQDDDRRQISLEDLTRAHDESIWRRNGVSDLLAPYGRSFAIQPSAKLLARILRYWCSREGSGLREAGGLRAGE
jgi:hypothetical protein